MEEVWAMCLVPQEWSLGESWLPSLGTAAQAAAPGAARPCRPQVGLGYGLA